MAQNAELKINSESVEKTTAAIEGLIDGLGKLPGAEEAATGAAGKNEQAQKRVAAAMRSAQIAREKAASILELEKKGLDKSSDAYAEQRAAILAVEKAKRLGIKTDSDQFKALKQNITETEKATAALKRHKMAQKESGEETYQSSVLANRFADALDGSLKQVQLIDGPLGGIASRMSALSGILRGANLGMAALGLSIGLLGNEFRKGIAVAADAEVVLTGLEAQVKATGHSAGITAEQLDLLARNLALNTLDNSQGVREIISTMLTFRKVSGDAFKESIELSMDLGIAMKQNPVSSARLLGKVLENPMKNFRQLKRLGVEFNREEKERLTDLQTSGELYEAQTIILDKLRGKFEGVARAQAATTLSGAVDTYGQLWEELWEGMGNEMLPTLTKIVGVGNDWLMLSQELRETDVQTAFREWSVSLVDGSNKATATLADTEATLRNVQDGIKQLKETTVQDTEEMTGVIGVYQEALSYLPVALAAGLGVAEDEGNSRDRAIALLEKQAEALEKIRVAQSGQVQGVQQLTEEQEVAIENLFRETSQAEKLTGVYLESGDTRSKAYRDAKAELDAYNIALKLGLENNKFELTTIENLLKAQADLTEERVRANTVIQKTKSLQSNTRTLEKELELYKLNAQGISKTSDEYLQLSARLDARNIALSAGFELNSKEHKQFEELTKGLADLNRELAVEKALRATSEESVRFRTLERELELQELLATGVRKNSAEYLREREAIDARNAAKLAGIEVGTVEYDQIIQQSQALADMQIKLNQLADLESLGLTRGALGSLIFEGTFEAIDAEIASRNRSIMELFTAGEIDQETYEQLQDQISKFATDERNKILLPLGIQMDEDGQQFLAESVEAVVNERNELLQELQTAFDDGQIDSEVLFQERRLAVIREYSEKIQEAKRKELMATEDMIILGKTSETAAYVKSAADKLQAVRGESKGLARIVKGMATFQASASLVEFLASAPDGSATWYQTLAHYAQAAAMGANVISTAASLREPSFAFGGVDIEGPGTGRSDSIRANIARGESVITAPATARHKDTLRRMNAGLPISPGGQGQGLVNAPQITIQGDASEQTVMLIQEALRENEVRVRQIAEGVSMETIQTEQQVGGLLDPI